MTPFLGFLVAGTCPDLQAWETWYNQPVVIFVMFALGIPLFIYVLRVAYGVGGRRQGQGQGRR